MAKKKKKKSKPTKVATKRRRREVSEEVEDQEEDSGDINFSEFVADAEDLEGEGFFVPSEENDGLITAQSYIPFPEEFAEITTEKGLPCGHIIHTAGDSDTGKTTFAVEAITQVQSLNGLALYGLTERKFDIYRAMDMGMNRDKAAFYKPRSIESFFRMGLERIEKFRVKHPSKPIVWLFDSLTAASSEYEIDPTKENHNMRNAMAITGELRRIGWHLDYNQVCLILINRVYQKQTSMPGEKKTATYGGKSPKGFSTIQLEFVKFATLKVERKGEKIPAGIVTQIENTKNHLASPFKKLKIKIDKAGFVTGGRKVEI